MGIELLAMSNQHQGLMTMMMEDHLVVCLVVTSVLEGLVAADMIQEHYEAAHHRRLLEPDVVKMAIVSNCGQKRKVSVQVGAEVANPRCGYQQKCVVAGSGCMVVMPHFQGYCLHFHLELEWRVEEVVGAVGVGVQLAVWPMMGNKFLCQWSRIDVEKSQGVLELEALQASGVEDRPMTLAANLGIDREALRVGTAVVHCRPA